MEEERDIGRVSIRDYYNFFSLAWGWFGIVVLLLLNVIVTLLQLGSSYTLSRWSTLPYKEQQEKHGYPLAFALFNITFVVVSILRGAFTVFLILTCSTKIHN